MNSTAQELFHLTSALSQLTNKDKIIQLFIESMNEIFYDYKFKWSTEKVSDSDKTIEVSTKHKSYGYLLLALNKKLNETNFNLIQNAAQLLAVFLENTEQPNPEREENHQNLIHKIQAAVVVHGSNTEILSCNTKAQELLGLTKDQMLGKTAIDPAWHFFREDNTVMPLEEYPVNVVMSNKKKLKDYIVGVHRSNNEKDIWCLVNADPVFDNNKQIKEVVVTFSDITEHKLAEQERRNHLWFFESLDKINRTIQGANGLEQMMSNVLESMLAIFGCDRAFLMHPCDTLSETWSVLIEKCKPEYPGVLKKGEKVKMDKEVAKILEIILGSDEPVKFGQGTPNPLSEDLLRKYNFKCFISMAIYPKIGKPWQLGMHQCAYIRQWTIQEEKLFQEIGRRFTDAITGLLSHQNLLESEQRYRMVFENSPVSIWEEDFSEIKKLFDSLRLKGVEDIEAYFNQHPETVNKCAEMAKIVNVNNSALALHEARNKEELMANLVNTFTPESFNTFRKELVCIWNGCTEMINDAIVKTIHGKPRNVTVYFSVCPGYEKTLSKVLVSLIDITDRKNSEEALTDTARRLSEAQRLAHIGSWELDLINDNLTWSDEIFRIFEIDPNKFGANYESFINTVHPDDKEAVDFAYRNSLATKTPYKIEHRLKFPDGRIKHVLEQCESFYDGDNPIRSIGTVQDITERKQMAEAIITQEREFRTLAENSPDIIARYNKDCQTVYINPAMEKILGRPSSEIIGTVQLKSESVAENEEYQKNIVEVITTGKNKEMDLVLPDIGSGPRYHNIRFTAERGADGKITGVLAIGRDVTFRRLAEAKINKLNLELEQRVAQRTSQLELANKELEAFAYSVSHDLRAPLRSINGFSQIILDEYKDKLDDQGLEYLNRVKSATKKMNYLITDMLKLSRISLGEIKSKKVNLSTMAQDIAKLLHESKPERKVNFKIQKGITCYADERLVQIALKNLLENAWKFTSKHESANIEFASISGQEKAIYYVRDDGAGFNMNYANRLFGVFQRLHSINEFPGTGIGLATVQRIIRKHGGKIWAEGEIEKGATLYFTL